MSALLEPPPLKVANTKKSRLRAQGNRAGVSKRAVKEKLPIYRFTRAELYKLCDDGWFADKRVNLIDGRIIVMPLPDPRHDYTLEQLVEILQSIIPAAHFVRQEKGLGVGEYTDPGPDVTVLPGSRRDYIEARPSTALFVAEISNKTLSADLRVKPAIYARAGVPEYWVIDLKGRRIVVHTRPRTDGGVQSYGSVVTYVEGQTVAPHFAPAAAISVEALLPPAEAV